ncbi:MAG TPA: carbohydrate-binding family 9-like protein [Candidatus Sumerlaeota bacterium]|nr:carbohydrate-binding family 9-like protein [Candidatus Sumerlaeota bacterium]
MTSLLIKKLLHEKTVPISKVGACLEAETDEIPIARINWPKHPYCPKVSFRIGHIQTEIWLTFCVSEERIRALETRTHGAVYNDSCVEFFVSFDGTNYYNFEINCIGTPHVAYGSSRNGRKFVPEPLVDKMVIQSTLGNRPFEEKAGGFEWAMTVRIPVECFAFDTIASLSGVRATANFYKVGSGMSVPHYVTWAPVGTEAPDYHRPEYFAGIHFE